MSEGKSARRTLKFLDYFLCRELNDNFDIRIFIKDFQEDNEALTYEFGRFKVGNRVILEKRKFGKLMLKKLLQGAEVFVSDNYAKLRPISMLIFNVMWYILLGTRCTTLTHAACVGDGNEGYLINAWLGGGKTISTLWLISRGFDFLSDDMTLINKDGVAFAFPTPLKLFSPHLKLIKSVSLRARGKAFFGALLKEVPIVRRYVELAYRPSINQIFPKVQIVDRVPIRYLILLRKSHFNDIKSADRDLAAKILSMQNLWERIYWIDRIFVPYSFSDPNFDLNLLHRREFEILRNSLNEVECFELRYNVSAIDALEKFILHK